MVSKACRGIKDLLQMVQKTKKYMYIYRSTSIIMLKGVEVNFFSVVLKLVLEAKCTE